MYLAYCIPATLLWSAVKYRSDCCGRVCASTVEEGPPTLGPRRLLKSIFCRGLLYIDVLFIFVCPFICPYLCLSLLFARLVLHQCFRSTGREDDECMKQTCVLCSVYSEYARAYLWHSSGTSWLPSWILSTLIISFVSSAAYGTQITRENNALSIFT